jgi:hypothetical protein
MLPQEAAWVCARGYTWVYLLKLPALDRRRSVCHRNATHKSHSPANVVLMKEHGKHGRYSSRVLTVRLREIHAYMGYLQVSD